MIAALNRPPAVSGGEVEIDVRTPLPSKHGRFEIVLFSHRPSGEQHLAIVQERAPDAVPLVRLHSECATGDLFGSLRCDCGPQLDAALERLGACDRGYLVYLRQEGRGIGLAAKLLAYRLQDEGADTVDANLQLGLPVDSRRYDAAAAFLRSAGVQRMRLLTNNPDKIAQLEAAGFVVAREPLVIDANPHSLRYLTTKRERMGHLQAIAPRLRQDSSVA
jgi:3,4-dihydroxy 2-butanone 4-phosphate synthase/GTP cyclohydrolase II